MATATNPPGGSSSGPGAGIASYPWLDIAVGSGTGGSMRSPVGLNGTYAVLTSVYQYQNLALPFFNAYASANCNCHPFINPGPLARWAWGQKNANATTYNMAQHNQTIFKNWWSLSGYDLPSTTTCSEGISIYPYSMGQTQYRNVYTDAPTEPPMGWRDGRIATLAGVPDFVFPVGEVAYNSSVTLQEEYLPVTLSFVVARGCDLLLADLVTELQESVAIRAPGVGRRIYG
ncbi:uncharacterized protein BDV17DRAFT_290984 [Aspergillus undulatus]|uniref:uncharacterized protein n=1 Tax=Aspergillus undulatus TaxID=1810928 RepID=UPI003CCD0655